MVWKTLGGAVAAAALIALAYTPSNAQSLRGSPASVDRIHRQALNHRLTFFATASSIREAHSNGRLVRLQGSSNYELVAVSYPYVLPEVHTFVVRLASQYRAACGEKLVVTSATRPKSMRLANSVDKSVHPTGMAIDLRKPARTACRNWLRKTLLSLEGEGVIEATEEYSPPHFHVAVFPTPYTRYVARQGGPTYAANASPSQYRVRSGDSLWSIARENSTSVESLKSMNGLRSSSLKIGQVLVVSR